MGSGAVKNLTFLVANLRKIPILLHTCLLPLVEVRVSAPYLSAQNGLVLIITVYLVTMLTSLIIVEALRLWTVLLREVRLRREAKGNNEAR